MDTDPVCPGCHASIASATSAAPGEIKKVPGWVNMFPIFGGAIGGAVGGAIAGAMMADSGGRSYSRAAPATRGSSSVKRMLGLLFLLGGFLFLVIAPVLFYDTWKIAQWVPKEVAAAELRQTKDPKSYPGPWLAYTFEASKPAEMSVKRQRLNHGGDVEARGLFVPVEDAWMFVSVAPGFEGNRLVGRLSPLDPTLSKSLVERLRKVEPNATALLPYEFNAVDGCESDRRQRYTGAAVCAFLGLLGVGPGLLLCRKRRIV
jgi:hypothetical protein